MVEVPGLLMDRQETIRAIVPEEQTIPYTIDHWRRRFGADDDLEYLITEYPDQLSRGDVAGVAENVCQRRSDRWIRRLLLATMMWGFGKVGYGAYRTSEMLNAHDSLKALRKSLDLTGQGDIVGAYNVLTLPYCGATFRTKYLYFVGLGFQSEPLPVVLDSIVAERFRTHFGIDARNWSDANSYVHYVQLMDIWAKELGCRADCIELFLFDYGEGG